MDKSGDGKSNGATIVNLHAWKRAHEQQSTGEVRGKCKGSTGGVTIEERIERIKASISRINALIEELRNTGGTDNAQGKA